MCDESHGQHHHGDHEPRRLRDRFTISLTNLRGTGLPWQEVLSLVIANNWRKMRTGSICCGNPGQPGC